MIKRISAFLFVLLAFVTANAQDINHKLAKELLIWSNSSIAQSLPLDFGLMSFDRIDIAENSINYVYIIKDDAVFEEYSSIQDGLKDMLLDNFSQQISSMATSLILHIDSDMMLNYDYCNTSGSKVTVTFTPEDMYKVLGKSTIDPEFRAESMTYLLSSAIETISQDGPTQIVLDYTDDEYYAFRMYADGLWEDGYKLDLKDIVICNFASNEPGKFFPVISLYLGKGEKFTVEDRTAGKSTSDEITYKELLDIYKTFSEN